jgi:hypothetical protein
MISPPSIASGKRGNECFVAHCAGEELEQSLEGQSDEDGSTDHRNVQRHRLDGVRRDRQLAGAWPAIDRYHGYGVILRDRLGIALAHGVSLPRRPVDQRHADYDRADDPGGSAGQSKVFPRFPLER